MQSEVIYNGRHYTACAMGDGSLVVTRNAGRRKSDGNLGARLVGDNAKHWITSIRTAIDDGEASMLCRVLLPAPSIRIRR